MSINAYLDKGINVLDIQTFLVKNITYLTRLCCINDDIKIKRKQFHLYRKDPQKEDLDEKATKLMDEILDLEEEAGGLKSKLISKWGRVWEHYESYKDDGFNTLSSFNNFFNSYERSRIRL